MGKELSKSLQGARIKRIIEAVRNQYQAKDVHMVGYGALINSDLMNQLNNALNNVVSTLKEVPFYWYIAALSLMFVVFKLVMTK